MIFDPTKTRLSEHFLLSDFLGNHTVYTKGRSNLLLPTDRELPTKMANAKALCKNFLEPFLEQAGPISITYGFISPELSDEIVHYQDSRKPSHHMWNLGAACDFITHEWINHDPEDDSIATAPISLAHEIVASGYPFSRLITYSESPCICIALSDAELKANRPRKAMYENRFVGGAKPDYRSYSTDSAKSVALARLKSDGLPNGWRGAGYPTYHGGGRRQLHHIRTSRYTMLSDFLFDLQSVANGVRNMPNVRDEVTMESFYLAGELYDTIVDTTGISRFSIIEGYVHPANPSFTKENDWANGQGWFRIVPPDSLGASTIITRLREVNLPNAYTEEDDGAVVVHFQTQQE